MHINFMCVYAMDFVCVCVPPYQVVSRLRDSCGDLDEEELGKLSVALLNCQSQAEGRQTFTCSEHMVRSKSPRPHPSQRGGSGNLP